MKLSKWPLACLLAVAACGGDAGSAVDGGGLPDAGHTLAEFLPEVPAADGTARATFAGPISDKKDLIPGPAASGLVGDYYMRNSKVRLVIQAAERSIGIVPFGGNVIDAVVLGSDGKDASPDHFGELGMVYLVGRTCNHTKIEVLRDGAGGGAAVIRATGKTAVNDYVNLRGLGALPIPRAVDPDYNEDGAGCATTYTLEPGSATLQVAWTIFNPSAAEIKGPFGMLNDAGGSVELFTPRFGFAHIQGSFDSLTQSGDASVPYQVYQGPNVAYGLLPRLTTADTPSAGIVVAGAAMMIFGASQFLDILSRDKDYLRVPAGGGVTHRAELLIARDGGDVERAYRKNRGDTVTEVSGKVIARPSGTPARARVLVFGDANGDGAATLDAADPVRTYFDTREDGTFSGVLLPGKYLLRADIPDVTRSAVVAIEVKAAALAVPEIALPEPARFDYTVVDDADGRVTIPAKITVVGATPLAPDARVEQTHEVRFGIVRTVFSMHGASAPAGPQIADPAILLPAGGPYRIFFSHGPEWSVAWTNVTAVAGQKTVLPAVRLRRVVDTTGYVATAFHEHSVGSPDSPVPYEKRLASLVVEGIELFAGTDHDHLVDYDPLIDEQGLRGLIDAVVGVETTPFAYGHFNAYPLDLDDTDPSGGAPDWGQGSKQGFAMLPGEIFDDMRRRGARVVQVCHPRDIGTSGFQGYFGRAGLTFDFTTRSFGSVTINQDVPNADLRLPEDRAIFSEKFDAIELFKSFGRGDSDGDGVTEILELDRTTRDWMNFLSMGKVYAPIANGDTHTEVLDTAGMPRSLVRVPDDSPSAIAAGLDEDVWATIGAATQRDMMATGGPFIRVTEPGEGKPSVIGKTLTPTDGAVTLTITASSSAFADLDTIEIYANSTFDRVPGAPSALQPMACFTSRTGLDPKDTCKLAPFQGARPLEVMDVDAGNGMMRHEARATITLRAADIRNRPGATGLDAWVVVRVRGSGSMFPIVPEDTLGNDILDTMVNGDEEAMRAALRKHGTPPIATSAPIFIDFDGGGYRAPFQP